MITALEANKRVESNLKSARETLLGELDILIMEEINSENPLMFINVYESKYAAVRDVLEDLGYRVIISNERNEYMIMISWGD